MIIDSMPSNDFPHAHNGTRNKSYAVILRVVVNVRLYVDLSTLHHQSTSKNHFLFSCSVKGKRPRGFFLSSFLGPFRQLRPLQWLCPFFPRILVFTRSTHGGRYMLARLYSLAGGRGCEVDPNS
jgi:hypothetical protein